MLGTRLGFENMLIKTFPIVISFN